MRLFLVSVRNALSGIRYAYRHERNMRIHMRLAVLAGILLFALKVEAFEALLVTIALTLVIVSELVNTAIEKTLDILKPQQHPLAKAAKDCAAAAVLVCAIFAVIVGVVVLGPHLWEGPTWRWN